MFVIIVHLFAISGSPYLNIFTEKILEFQDRQIIQKIKRQYWRSDRNCSSMKRVTKNNELRMEHVGGIFLFLCSGILSGLILAFCEFVWKLNRARKKKHIKVISGAFFKFEIRMVNIENENKIFYSDCYVKEAE